MTFKGNLLDTLFYSHTVRLKAFHSSIKLNGPRIKSSGYYLLYSHLAFVPPVTVKKDYKNNSKYKEAFLFGQQIYSNRDIILKQSEITWFHWFPENENDNNNIVHKTQQNAHRKEPSSYFGCGDDRGSFYTSNLFGLVYIKKGSVIKVMSTPASWLCRSKKASYFGLIKFFDS
ncbi:hypothetical protein HELRODRAFT_178590 [Helobdella robusta]|uniref:Uncharacterized protein n=1 Tax=Helobdella robusta TaxID=6412 RepID=T1FDF6_HELRO|nr:hypothetical protein HELRODRAFT_178590 [Helobdella robusta]ESN96803.1 hypothetical protein HELRODRAFT_178590 [Helobdella robusta]